MLTNDGDFLQLRSARRPNNGKTTISSSDRNTRIPEELVSFRTTDNYLLSHLQGWDGMALITISGYPCSGKSRRATQIQNHLERRLMEPDYTGSSLTVTVVSDDTLNIPRSAYDGESFTVFAHGMTRTMTMIVTIFVPSNASRQPIGKAGARGAVHRSPAPSRQRSYRHRGLAQLHQRVPVPDVLRC